MGLPTTEINRDYFRTNQDLDRGCSICLNTFQNGERWIAHVNPDCNKYRIITRSFHQHVHPMHEACYEELRGSGSDQCPECRNIIGEPLHREERQRDERRDEEEEYLASFPTVTFTPSNCPLSDRFLATLGASVASLASGGGLIQTTVVSGITYATGNVISPLVAISLSATLGALRTIQFASAGIPTALAGAAIGIETLNLMQSSDHSSMVMGLGTCATILKLHLMTNTSQGLQLALNAAISTIISLALTKFVDTTANNRIF